jgi:hypothetical protein
MRALLPISHSPEREVEPRRKLFLRQIQPLAQRPHSWHTASTRKLSLGRWRSIRVRNSDSMTLLVAHCVEGTPICLWRLLRIELKSRDTSFFHAAPLSSCGYDANDVAPRRIGDEEHSPIDQIDGVEAQLASGIEIIKLDHVAVTASWSPANSMARRFVMARVGRGSREVEQLIVRMAGENRDWGYDRITGALANLGYMISDQTVGNVLQRPCSAARAGAQAHDHVAGLHPNPPGAVRGDRLLYCGGADAAAGW